MSEAETIEALSNITGSAVGFLSIFISITFAYLTVAYVVGANLTKLQVVVINGLYLFCALLSGSGSMIYWESWSKLHGRTNSVLNEVWLANEFLWTESGYLMFGSIIVMSVYFMHDIRKRSKK
jgi:hypothetical protein